MLLQNIRQSAWENKNAILAIAITIFAVIFVNAYIQSQPIVILYALAGAGAIAIALSLLVNPLIGIALVVFTLPFTHLSPKMDSGGLTSLQPVIILLPLTIAAVLVRASMLNDYKFKLAVLAQPTIIFTAAFLVLIGFRGPFVHPAGELLSLNIKTVGRFVMGALLFLLVTQFAKKQSHFNLLAGAYLAGGLVAGIIGFVQYFFGLWLETSYGGAAYVASMGDAYLMRVHSMLDSPHAYAFLEASCMLLAIYLAMYSKSILKKCFYYFLAAVYGFALYTSQTRAGLLFLIVGLAVVSLRHLNFRMIAAGMIGSIAIIILLISFPEYGGRYTAVLSGDNTEAARSSRSHIIIQSRAVASLEENPLWGTGLIYQAMGQRGPQTAHNTYLDLWLGGGVILLALFIWLIYCAIRVTWILSSPQANPGISAYASWLLASICGTAVFIMVDVLQLGYFRTFSFYFFLAFAASLAEFQKRENLPTEIMEPVNE